MAHQWRFPSWSTSQRVSLLTILAGLLLYSFVRYAMNRTFINDPPPTESSRMSELADRIDPNTADEATLAALPTLGEKRAKLIVEYRNSRARPNHIVFSEPNDLLRIRGIGVATLDQMKPFLIFPTATTRPSTQQRP